MPHDRGVRRLEERYLCHQGRCSAHRVLVYQRLTVYSQVTYACIEYTLQIDVPDEAFHHPVVESLSEAGNDILSWANDIYSFDNEQANGVRCMLS